MQLLIGWGMYQGRGGWEGVKFILILVSFYLACLSPSFFYSSRGYIFNVAAIEWVFNLHFQVSQRRIFQFPPFPTASFNSSLPSLPILRSRYLSNESFSSGIWWDLIIEKAPTLCRGYQLIFFSVLKWFFYLPLSLKTLVIASFSTCYVDRVYSYLVLCLIRFLSYCKEIIIYYFVCEWDRDGWFLYFARQLVYVRIRVDDAQISSFCHLYLRGEICLIYVNMRGLDNEWIFSLDNYEIAVFLFHYSGDVI